MWVSWGALQVTTLLSEADKRIAQAAEGAAAGSTQWLEEATARAEEVKASAAREAEQGEKIRALKEQARPPPPTPANLKPSLRLVTGHAIT